MRLYKSSVLFKDCRGVKDDRVGDGRLVSRSGMN